MLVFDKIFLRNYTHFVFPNLSPIIFCLSFFINFIGVILWFIWGFSPFRRLDSIILLFSLVYWMGDVIIETGSGQHSTLNLDCFKYRFLLFVFREIILFFRFFWLIFRNDFCPNPEVGFRWGESWSRFNPRRVPLFNRVILLTSRVTLTLFHLDTLTTNKSRLFLRLTVLLGIYFLTIQFVEYKINKVRMADGSLVSTFYVLTIFHGCHVMVGTIFLSLVLMSSFNKEVINIKNIVIDRSILYWHFVDVVWLFLFTFLYVWPNF